MKILIGLQNLSRQELEQTSYYWLLQSAGDWTRNPDKPKGIEWNIACVGRRVNVACSFKKAFKSSFRLQTPAKRTYLHTYILYRLQALYLRLLHGHMHVFWTVGGSRTYPNTGRTCRFNTGRLRLPVDSNLEPSCCEVTVFRTNCMMWNTRTLLIITQFWCGFVYFGPSKRTKLTLRPVLSGLI